MPTLREACARLLAFCRRGALDREFDEEVAAHIELATDEHVRRGVPLPEARRLALVQFGGIASAKQQYHESSGLPWVDTLIQDVRYAARALARTPGLVTTAIVTIAVGIGANAAVFTVVNAVLFKGFRTVHENDRILYIGTQKNGRGCCVSYPDFRDWRAQVTSFDDLGAVADARVTFVDRNGAAESYTATRVTTNTFTVLGQTPVVGRNFIPADGAPGAPRVAILSYGFWERKYGLDPAVVGSTVRIDGTATTIVGVMRQGFSFPQNQDFWIPIVPTPDLERREARGLWFAFGRMKDGVTIGHARTEFEVIGGRLASAYPATNEGWVPRPVVFTEFFVGRNATVIYGALWGAVGFVLLIACANLANLLLVRATGRTREVALCVALGAGRWRIVRQFLIESLMLSAAGGLLGWWLAGWCVRLYELRANPPTLTWSAHLLDYSMDNRVLLYVIAITVITGVLFGIAPALRLSRLDVHQTLKDGGRGATGGRRSRDVMGLLVICEMALTVVLLAGAGVMVRSFLRMHNASLGVRTDNVLTMLMKLSEASYANSSAQTGFFDRLVARLEATPGVESVTVASTIPTASGTRLTYQLPGATIDEGDRPTVSAVFIGPSYFRTLGASVQSGREFNAFDGGSTNPPLIVNERFAQKHWPGEDAVGKRLQVFDGETATSFSVVGVVANVLQDDPDRRHQEFGPVVYLRYEQRPATGMWVLVRTNGATADYGQMFRREVHAIDRELSIWLGPYSLDDRLAAHGSYWSIGTNGALLIGFAAAALVLASVGLYAVIAHSVAQRTQEIGVRIAVGGTAAHILKIVLGQGMRRTAIGLAIGLAASIVVTRVLSSVLVQVSAADPVTYVLASAVLLASAALGCVVPARRAIAVDPVVALRPE